MASLNLDINYFDNVKTLRLVARLGHGADVLPIRLWAWVAKHRPSDGILEGYQPKEIEQLCGWWGEPLAMLQAMLDFGFLNAYRNRDRERVTSETLFTADPPLFFEIHDWLDHSGHLAAFHKRAIKAARKRWGVSKKSSNATSNAKSKSKQCPSSSLHNSTEHNVLTPPLGAKTAAPGDSVGASKPNGQTPDPRISELIKEFFRRLETKLAEKPKGFNGGAAGRLFTALLKDYPPEEIIRRMQAWFDSNDPFIVKNTWRVEMFATYFNTLKGGPLAHGNPAARGYIGAAPIAGKYAALGHRPKDAG